MTAPPSPPSPPSPPPEVPAVEVPVVESDAAPGGSARLPAATLDRVLVHAIRVSLGLLFVWFGVLKVMGESPVAGLVSSTLPWVDPDLLLPGLGWFEIALGLALVAGWPRRLALLVAAGHLGGTFLAFVEAPALLLDVDNPLLLTTAGEFVTKNVVLVCVLLLLLRHHAPDESRR